MNKKLLISLLVILLLLIIVLGTIALVERHRYITSIGTVNEAMQLSREGQRDLAYAKCYEERYRTGICYLSELKSKIAQNETVTAEFCESIPSGDEEPFYLPSHAVYVREMIKTKALCVDYIP